MTQPEVGADPRPAPVSGRRRTLLGAGLAVVAAVALTATITLWLGPGGSTGAAPARPTPSASASAPPTVSEIFQALAPSVVLIESTGGGSSNVDHDAGAGTAAAGTAQVSATGTGVIANADGTILTARHVVAGATTIRVTFADGTRSTAEVAAEDPATDIAALSPAQLPSVVVPAVLGSARLAIGDPVVAIGNQLGLADSTTTGVVSGLDRSVSRAGASDLDGLIQFDAAVNPGSSGGPLVNDRGELVGIVVALANPTDAGTFIGIGFAVPIGSAVGSGAGDGRAPPL